MPVAEAVGWAAAVRYLEKLGMEHVAEHESSLTEYALEHLAKVPGLTIYGPLETANRVGVVSFTVDGVHAHDLATILDQGGVALRSGHHCAHPLHDKLGLPATARASFSVYNTAGDIDRLAAGVCDAQKVFQAA
jgi:cysteine desulfurase/selenocysteine lyase